MFKIVYWLCYQVKTNKVSGFWLSAGLKIMYTHLLESDQISHTQSIGGSETPHKWGKRSYPYVKRHGRIPIDSAILAAIGHRFIAKHKWKLKMPDARV